MKITHMVSVSVVLCLAFMPGRTGVASSGNLTTDTRKAYSPCGYDFQIRTTPGLATMDDAIQVSYSATWSNSCAPRHQSHQIVDNVIRLDAVRQVPSYPHFCLDVLMPWGADINVGTLPPGSYKIDVYLTEVVTPPVYPPPVYPSTLCGTKSFTVYEELQELHLPIVARHPGNS